MAETKINSNQLQDGGGGEQNIKAYHAPSATLDATLGVPIPNVDACTEQGLYNVDYSFESDGGTITSNALLEVSETSISGISVITQNLLINVGTELVHCTRNYMSNTFTSWAGQNIPAELAKGLQNTATGANALTILGNATNKTNSINIGNSTSASAANSTIIGVGAYSGTAGGPTAIGASSLAEGGKSVGIGYMARARNQDSVQLGTGENNVYKQFQVYEYPMLDGNTGKIPNERLGIIITCPEKEMVDTDHRTSFYIPKGEALDNLKTAGNYFVQYEDEGWKSTFILNVCAEEGYCDQNLIVGDVASGEISFCYRYWDTEDGWSEWEAYSAQRPKAIYTNLTSADTNLNVVPNSIYNFKNNAITTLTITGGVSIDNYKEIEIYFTSGNSITVTIPNNMKTIGDFTFAPNKSYVISICNGIAVRGELN